MPKPPASAVYRYLDENRSRSALKEYPREGDVTPGLDIALYLAIMVFGLRLGR